MVGGHRFLPSYYVGCDQGWQKSQNLTGIFSWTPFSNAVFFVPLTHWFVEGGIKGANSEFSTVDRLVVSRAIVTMRRSVQLHSHFPY